MNHKNTWSYLAMFAMFLIAPLSAKGEHGGFNPDDVRSDVRPDDVSRGYGGAKRNEADDTYYTGAERSNVNPNSVTEKLKAALTKFVPSLSGLYTSGRTGDYTKALGFFDQLHEILTGKKWTEEQKAASQLASDGKFRELNQVLAERKKAGLPGFSQLTVAGKQVALTPNVLRAIATYDGLSGQKQYGAAYDVLKSAGLTARVAPEWSNAVAPKGVKSYTGFERYSGSGYTGGTDDGGTYRGVRGPITPSGGKACAVASPVPGVCSIARH